MTAPTREQVLQVFGDRIADSHPLPASGPVTLGRGEDADVRIDHSSISRAHARLHLGPQPAIEDLGSKNGTIVRGVRHDQTGTARMVETRAVSGARVPVLPGDVISVGSVLVTLQPAGVSAVRPAQKTRPADVPAGVVIEDAAMRALYELAGQMAAGEICVLLRGETGVGKDVLAEAIHRASPRAKRPMVRLNCAAFSETLLESELFGHEKGAFTGAARAKPGLLETAQGGSIFLDEVGELPLSTQVKLLRVLEAREVLPVGALRPRPIDVRFISATNRDLEGDMARGSFRQDLYFRLNGISLVVPPLRERRGEIVPVARAMAAEAARKLGRRPVDLSPDGVRALEAHPWPGNLRELRNVIDRAVLLCGSGPITPAALSFDAPARTAAAPTPAKLTPAMATPTALPAASAGPLKDELDALERQRILDALEQAGGNQTEAARALGMARRTLINRIEAYGIKRPRKPKP